MGFYRLCTDEFFWASRQYLPDPALLNDKATGGIYYYHFNCPTLMARLTATHLVVVRVQLCGRIGAHRLRVVMLLSVHGQDRFQEVGGLLPLLLRLDVERCIEAAMSNSSGYGFW